VLLAAPSVFGRALVAAKARPADSEPRRSNFKHLGGVSLSGACACSVTHCLVLPLDVIKTRMQMDAAASAKGMVAVAGSVFREAPGAGLVRLTAFFSGLPPTAVGYFLQGATKFGGYEFFKQQWFGKLRAEGGEALVQQWQLPVMLMSAATAELGATVLLAPMEVLKLRLQTDAASASRGVLRTFATIMRQEGAQAFYAGLAPIAMRQLPYTVTKVCVCVCARAALRRPC
jgi:solute carrier family 25 phosphate transporter 3